MITIANQRKTRPIDYHIYVDRGTIYGNPFKMTYESERDAVCDQYKTYFYEKLESDPTFYEAVEFIVDIAKKKDIQLLCWCAPKRCHAETIKEYVEKRLKEEAEG